MQVMNCSTMHWSAAGGTWQGSQASHVGRRASRSWVRPVCYVEAAKARQAPQVAEPLLQQVPTSAEDRFPTSATDVALQLSRQLGLNQFEPWDQETVWRAVAGVEPASTVEVVPAPPELDGESKALQRLQERIEAARLSAIDAEEQLFRLRSDILARLSQDAQRAIHGLETELESAEAELRALGKGPKAAVRLEQQQQGLRWQIYQQLQLAASGQEAGLYRSLLASLELERQLVLVLESREALHRRSAGSREGHRIKALSQQQVAAAQQLPQDATQGYLARQQECKEAARLLSSPAQHAPSAVELPHASDDPRWAAAAVPSTLHQGASPFSSSSFDPGQGATDWAASGHLPPLALVESPATRQSADPPAVQAAHTAAMRQLRLVAAGCMIPHPDKAETGGEDAFFISRQGCGAVGVADGVSGWAAEGIDPALYPRELLAACEAGLAESADLLEEPLALLLHAHTRAQAAGSCTVCLAGMQADGQLRVASLGDCGVVVVRPGQGVVFRAEIQEHEFNMPYQMASLDFLPDSDHPEEAQQYVVEVQRGDVVLLGSDGLFDNLWEEDLCDTVEAHLGGLQQGPSESAALERAAQDLAAELAQRAHQHSQDPTYVSPFAVERHERVVHPLVRRFTQPTGGKLDDVTIVVGLLSF